MTPKMIGDLFNAAIPMFGGLYATLLGYQIIGKQPGVDPLYDARMAKLTPLFKILGPFLMVFGSFLIVKDLFM